MHATSARHLPYDYDVWGNAQEIGSPMTAEASILIVEDDRAALEWLEELLGGAGYHVTGVSSFEEARHALAVDAPDLLITDVRLGAYNGLQLIFRARALNPQLPVIVMTGYSDAAIRAEAHRLKAVHLEKPIESDGLLRLVAGMLVRPGPTLHPDR
jgi:two-component system C4-dicarboxylate transport response regulator DctD